MWAGGGIAAVGMLGDAGGSRVQRPGVEGFGMKAQRKAKTKNTESIPKTAGHGCYPMPFTTMPVVPHQIQTPITGNDCFPMSIVVHL